MCTDQAIYEWSNLIHKLLIHLQKSEYKAYHLFYFQIGVLGLVKPSISGLQKAHIIGGFTQLP